MKKIMFNDKYGLTAAVLNGQKTMTRRIIPLTDTDRDYLENAFDWDLRESVIIDYYARYEVGEIVAVAQAYKDVRKGGYPVDSRYDAFREVDWGIGVNGVLNGTAGENNKMFVKAEWMPHHIRITDIKMERLKSISDDDCMKEGILHWKGSAYENLSTEHFHFRGCNETFSSAKEAFAAFIDKVSGKGTWDSNPWVFAYSFELID